MKRSQLPNFLTVLRIFLIPILILSFYLDAKLASIVAVSIFVFASITDFVDGFLARKWEVQSDFGRMLDPIADKLLVASTLMMLVHFQKAPVIPTIIILCREILVSGMREHLGKISVNMPVSTLGKIKTGFQMMAITILIIADDVKHIPYLSEFGVFSIWFAAGLTVVSGYAYCREGFKHV
jgi:cardiolipin synthase